MPQLDIYIICNMLYSVIIVFILIYILNISNILIIINLLLRVRKLKFFLEKKQISKILKESLKKIILKFQNFTFYLKYKQVLITHKFIFSKDAFDIKNLVKSKKQK
jgi:hypothetical protein